MGSCVTDQLPLCHNVTLMEAFWIAVLSFFRYYGSKTNFLTIDHVVPKHDGGRWEWENLVAACSECNAKKGAKSLKQLKWALKTPPRVRFLPEYVWWDQAVHKDCI